MQKRFGQFKKNRGEGQLRPLYFPSLTTLDEWTGDRRLIEAGGFGSRELPRPIFAQPFQFPGHLYSVPIGSLQEVTAEESGNVTARGWLLDAPHVREHFVPMIASETLFHNSVDLAEVKIRWGSDDWMDEAFWDMIMVEANLAATTIVGVPAFKDARASLQDFDDELVASFLADPEPIEIPFSSTKLRIPGFDDALELTASAGAPVAAFDSFHMPEPNQPTPHTVTADRKVFGHVADWNLPHAGNGRFCPRPGSYDSFHAGSTLTDRGLVRTGTIFFLGGHPDRPLGREDAHRAYGGVENSWATVRVSNGRFGPWYCGEVIPGMSDEAVALARATPISGHWSSDDQMKAIVSVNVRGFDIPNSSLSYDHDGARLDAEGRVLELVASLHSAKPEPPVVVTAPEAVTPNVTLSDGYIMFTLPSTIFAGTDGVTFETSSDTTMTAETTDEVELTDDEPEDSEADEDGDDDELDAALLDIDLALVGELPLTGSSEQHSHQADVHA